MAKGKQRGARGKDGQDLASADTVAVADSRDPDARVPTVKRARRDSGEITSDRPDGLSLRRGDEVARFIVVEKIGEGGMAVVYSAYDPRLDRSVALKLMRPGASEQESPKQSQRRLLREAQALARLSHPNVVVVHEVDEVQGQVYLAMEYVDGGTLREWRRDQPRTWQEVVDIYCRAGRGLAAAHREGLVHRDFKPENVLVGKHDRVLVTDFGLVGTTEALAESTPPADRRGRFPTAVPLSSETEAHGLVLGTPGYVAPELYRGHSASERSDQFSFCVSLFEALYEQRPFAGENAAEVATNTVDGKIRAAPESSDVPDWVGEVLRRGLATDPDDRHASVSGLLEALRADPLAARRQRLRTIAAVVGFAALASLAFFGLTRSSGGAPATCADAGRKLAAVWNEESKDAVQSSFEATGLPYALDTYERVAEALDSYSIGWTAMRVEACEATHVRGEQSEAALDARMWCLDRRLGELTAYVELVSTDVDRKLLERAVGAAGALLDLSMCADVETLTATVPLPDDPALLERVTQLSEKIDRVAVLSRAEMTTKALALSKPLVEEARQVGWPHALARVLYEHAMLEDDIGAPAAAERALREALRLAAQARNDHLVASIYVQLIRVVGHSSGRFEEALAMRVSVEAAIARAGDPPHLHLRYQSSLGATFDTKGRYQEALTHYRESLRAHRKSYGASHRNSAAALNNVAIMLDTLGRHAEARDAYTEALEIEEQTFGSDHPRVARALNNLAVALDNLGELDAALDALERALAMWKKAYGDDHIMVATTLLNIGVTLQGKKEIGRARERYEEARTRLEKSEGRNRAALAMVLANLGELDELERQYDRAMAHYERSLGTWEGVAGPDHPEVAYAVLGIGNCHLAQGNTKAAIAHYERALRLRTANSVDPAEVGEAQFKLARALWRSGRERSRAKALAVKARASYRGAGEASTAKTADVEAWLAKHGVAVRD